MRKVIVGLFLFSSAVSAQIESIINFQGQNAETINIDKMVQVVRPQSFEVPSTCERQIPYEVYECHDETRYRESCSWVPARENCWSEPESVCRNVTRYREECHSGPSRRVCRDIPSREVCTERPSREVCTERPTREVCRTNSRGENVCQTVGGGQSCQTVGGGQSCQTVGGGQTCHDEAGERVCRDVAYTDQDCDTVSRQRCETIPGHNECQDIPYSEEVCGNVTRYNTEEYACTRTEIREITTSKQLKGQIQVNFATNGVVEEFPIALVVAPKSKEFKELEIKASLKKEPKVVVALQSKRIKIVEETEKEILIEGSAGFETLDLEVMPPVFPENLNEISINKETHLVSLGIEGGISGAGSISVELIHTPLIGKDKKIAELTAEYPSEKVKLNGNKLEVNLKGLVNKLEKRMVLNVKLTSPLMMQGEVLNAVKPSPSKEFKSLLIKQQ